MEDVSLTETETRYFSDLFLCCDVEKTGKIPMLKAMELYRSANLPNEVVLEITSLAGIPDTALHISRSQFYSCLKLIAAFQAAMPLRQELIVATVQLPLPRFSWKDTGSVVDGMPNSTTALHHLHQQQQQQQQQQQANGFSVIPPPPDRKNSLPRVSSRRNSSVHQQQEASVHSDVPSTDSEVEQNESSCGGGGGGGGMTGSGSRETHRRRGSPEAWSTNSDSPTPTNSVAERLWAKETLWQSLLGDEHRQLLGTEEESSDRHSSDEDNETDLETVYQITPEQRDYYLKQFKAVQHDINGLLSGQVARVFFEKSRIPVEELRHIWQLCDVTRDGALSLAEFTAAMHLVVLRRNNIPLPTVLPGCLHPSFLQTGQLPPKEPPEADLLHLNDDNDEDNTDNTLIGANITTGSTAMSAANARNAGNEKNVMNLSTLSTSSQASTNSRQGINTAAQSGHGPLTPPALPPPLKNRSVSNSPNAQTNTTPPNLSTVAGTAVAKPKDRTLWTTDVPPTQWTKFTESPTSNVSSPGPKPVNFDMQRTAQAVVSDPQILHPVPLRVTPVAGTTPNTTTDAPNQETYESVIMRESSPKQQQQQLQQQQQQQQLQQQQQSQQIPLNPAPHHRDSMQNNDLRAIQRPQAKKLPVKNIGALPPPPQRESSIGGSGGGNNTSTSAGASGDADITNMNAAVMVQQQQQSQQPQSQQQQQQPQVLPHQAQVITSKKEPPPLPPPRPHRHGRSSSLDLNKFKMNTPAGQQPEITAQASFDLQTSTGFADFTNFPDGANITDQIPEHQQHSLPPQMLAATNSSGAAPPPSHPPPPTRFTLQTNQRVSAFEVYRKPNTPRSSQSPSAPATAAATSTASTVELTQTSTAAHQHYHPQPTLPPPPAPAPAPAPFGAVAASAFAQHASVSGSSAAAALPNADLYEKRVNAISETLRHVSFKQDNNMPDVLRHLREQNNLLLRLCNDLSDELLTVQTRKEEMRLKLECLKLPTAAAATTNSNMNVNNACDATQSGGGGGGVGYAAAQLARTGSSISAPVTANVTGGSGSSGVHSNI